MSEFQTAQNMLEANEWLEQAVRNGDILSADQWLDLAQRMNVLRGEYDDKLVDLQCSLANKKVLLLATDNKMTVAKADVHIEASPEYAEMRKLEALLGRVTESSRIAKKRAELANSDLHGYGK